MAFAVFDPSKKYRCRLYRDADKGFPVLVGHLAADTREVDNPVFGEHEFAMFTVDEPVNGEFPPDWVGTYGLPMSAKNLWFDGEVDE